MAGNPDNENLISLLKVAEELLFSFPLPQDVVSKYEFIRSKTFSKIHLPNQNSHIKRLQIEAHCKLEKDSSKIINTSALELKDLELQTKYQNTLFLLQKSLTLLERCSKMFLHLSSLCEKILSPEVKTYAKTTSKFLDIPLNTFDGNDSDCESSLESLKVKILANEHDLVQLISKLEDKALSNSVYIEKLELETRENSGFLSRNNSELLEKNKILQDKINKERLENEKKIKELREEVLLSKTNSLNDVRKAQVREIEKIMQERDMFQDEAERLKEQLDSVSFTLQKEIRTLNEDYDRSSQEMIQKFSYQLKESEMKHIQKIEALEKKLYFKEKEFSEEIEKRTLDKKLEVSRLEKDLNFCRNKAESLENCLENIKVISERIYKRFSDEPVEAKDFNQGVSKLVEFLDRVIDKLSKDNNWLVDRMSELNKENESLKKSVKDLRVQETLNDLETSSTVLKSFEQSRERLKKQFSESSVPFPDTYSKLVHKYSNLS